jgi:hypothetical protein
MFEKDKQKSEPFAFFKNTVKKPHAIRKTLTWISDSIFNMIKWNVITFITFLSIFFISFGIDSLFFAEEREQQWHDQIMTAQYERVQETIKNNADLKKFNEDIILAIKEQKNPNSKETLKILYSKSQKFNVIMNSKNLLEINLNFHNDPDVRYIFNFTDKKSPLIYLYSYNEQILKDFINLAKTEKISINTDINSDVPVRSDKPKAFEITFD